MQSSIAQDAQSSIAPECRTYTTDYAGSVATDGTANVGTAGAEPAWEATNEGPDRSMLMARDPILFWDEIPLYESELDDNGVSQLRVKASLFTTQQAALKTLAGLHMQQRTWQCAS